MMLVWRHAVHVILVVTRVLMPLHVRLALQISIRQSMLLQAAIFVSVFMDITRM